MSAQIKEGVFDVDGVKVKASFKVVGRALRKGVATAVRFAEKIYDSKNA